MTQILIVKLFSNENSTNGNRKLSNGNMPSNEFLDILNTYL